MSGFGLHRGTPTCVQIRPNPEPAVRLVRVDVPSAGVDLTPDRGDPQRRRTAIKGLDGSSLVETVEHVLSALAGLGIWQAIIEVDGPEVPAMDGSAAPFVDALLAASEPATEPRPAFRVLRPFRHQQGHASCSFAPAKALSLECRIAFEHPAIGAQRYCYQPHNSDYRTEIGPARTFGFLAEVDELHRAGLALGASTENVLVFDAEAPMSALRFPDEPVRHKVLDAIGDLATLGGPLAAAVTLEKASHRLLLEALSRARAEGVLVATSAA